MVATCCIEKYIGCLSNGSHFSRSVSAFCFSFLYCRNEKITFLQQSEKIHSFHMSTLYFQKRTKSQTVLIFAKSAKECQRFQYEHFSLKSPKARLFIRFNIIALYYCWISTNVCILLFLRKSKSKSLSKPLYKAIQLPSGHI